MTTSACTFGSLLSRTAINAKQPSALRACTYGTRSMCRLSKRGVNYYQLDWKYNHTSTWCVDHGSNRWDAIN